MQAEAVLISQHGGPEVLELKKIKVPQPQADQVTIQQKAIGLNFIDIYLRTGLYKHDLPHGLGFEAAGEVVAVGANVSHLTPGDRVVYGMGPAGAYTSLRTLDANYVVKIPDNLSFEQAAALYMKGLTVQCLFRQVHALQNGQTILFHAAAGGVGLLACQWAKALGVRLIGTVSTPEKAQQALEHGAWKTINYTQENVVQKVLEFTDQKKLPVVYDSVGQATWLQSLDCLAPRGLMVSFGNASGPVTNVNLADLASRGSLYVTRPSMTHFVNTPQALQAASQEVFDLFEQGKLRVTVGQRFALRDAAQAHKALAARKTIGATVLLP